MRPPVDARMRTFRLPGSRGPLTAVHFLPPATVAHRGDVLVAPAFAEEMNRCRAMVALQARALAATGIGTLVLDVFGTGDSAGEFAEADWATWREDLRLALDWLATHGPGCRALLGIRLGAIMAVELALRTPSAPRVVLWQPVLNGKTFLTQFLRIRIAAEMDQPGGVKSTEELRRLALSGRCVEVSGYELSPTLMSELDALAMPRAEELRALQFDWFEVLASADAGVPRATSKAVEDLRAAGVSIDLTTVPGPPFWQVHERELAPDLITATTQRLTAALADAATTQSPAALPPAEPPVVEGDEVPLVFPCGDVELAGILHHPRPASRRDRGVVIVVAGGPQYRAGAHRQFVGLARKLAGHGYPVMRFDLRGMGDSDGAHLGFQKSDLDIRAAIDALLREQPQLREVVLFGECESASGILFYAWRDARVAGAVLVNPWVRTDEGQAQVIIKHYYWDRLRSPEFWRSVREGRFDWRRSMSSFLEVARAYVRGRRNLSRRSDRSEQDDLDGLPLPEKTAAGLRRFRGRVMLLMSGRDYIAREFDEVTGLSAAWSGLLDDPRILRRDLVDADHTFSRAEWKAQASDWVVEWLAGW